MTDFLLMSVGLAQLVQIVIMFRILRNFDRTDFSEEDAQVRRMTNRTKRVGEQVSEVINQLRK